MISINATSCTDCGFGCNGGSIEQAYKYWIHKGLVSGGLFGDDKTCKPYNFPPCGHHITSDRDVQCMDDVHLTPKCRQKCVNNENIETDR